MKNKSFTLLLLAVCTLTVHKSSAQATGERLIAHCFYFTSGDSLYPGDSVTYIYSGSRSVDAAFTYDVQAFDSSYNWRRGIQGPYLPSYYEFLTTQTWSQNGKRDTMFFYALDTPSQYMHAYSFIKFHTITVGADSPILQYDTASRAYYDTASRTWSLSDIKVNLFSNNIRPREYDDYSWNRTWHRWDTLSMTLYDYDSLGRLLDVGGSYSRTRYIYDSLGSIATILYQNYLGSSWVNNWIDSFYFDANHDPYLMRYLFVPRNGPLSLAGVTSYTYDNHHQCLSAIHRDYRSNGPIFSIDTSLYAYDTLGMLTLYTYLSWDTSGGAWHFQNSCFSNHYYYETYDLPAGIADISVSGEMHIYPVPAAEMINIDLTWPEAQKARAAIYDAAGHKYMEWSLPEKASIHSYVPAQSLPQGSYYLTVSGEKGTMSKSFNVVR